MYGSVGSFGSRPQSRKKGDSLVDSCGFDLYANST